MDGVIEDDFPPQKPISVRYAQYALWLWTLETCLVGIYQTWKSIPEIEQAMSDQLQGLIEIDPQTLLHYVVGGYVIVALISAWIIIEVGRGKKWARASLLVGIICELGWEVVSDVAFSGLAGGHTVATLLADIPDYGLQIYALYYLYTSPGRSWFRDRVRSRRGTVVPRS